MNTSTVLIISLTSHIGEENRQKSKDAGINDVFIKPLSMEKCQKIIELLPGLLPQIPHPKG